MDVTWLGGSCVRLHAGGGSVLTDPFRLHLPGGTLSADVVPPSLREALGLSVPHAVAVASQLEAKLLVPLLLGGPDDRAALERFCRELASDTSNTEPRLSVTASGLPATARVVVLVPPQGLPGG